MKAAARKTSAMSALGNILKSAVNTGVCTPGDIVERTGIAKSFVYRAINGEAEDCTVSTLQALCEAVGAHPADVFGERKGAPKAVIAAWEAVGKWLKGK